jgi:hypothetical protein
MKCFFLLLTLVGIGYFTYFLGFDGGVLDYQQRSETSGLEKTTFTYYFYWYDNNSDGNVEQSSHVYNNPSSFTTAHPYYMANYSLINESRNIAPTGYISYNISLLQNSQTPEKDFDMLQSFITTSATGVNLTVFGCNNSDYFKYVANNLTPIKRWGQITNSTLYHRAQYRLKDVSMIIIENPDTINSINFKIQSTVHNDTLSHHPDGTKFEGDFSYKNKEWHKYEIKNVMNAGIDVILPVYWGHRAGPFNTLGTEMFVEAMKELETEFGIEKIPKIGMFLDTTGLLVAAGKKPDLTTENGKSLFSEFINEFFEKIPERFLFRTNGADLVWMYGSNFVENYNDDTFLNARSNYTKQLGTNRDLIFVGVGFTKYARSTQFGSYSWGVSLNGATIKKDGIPIGCIGPGFYSEGAYRCGCQWKEGIRIQERRNGDYYSESFQEVMSGSKWVVIEVWNEYHEGNDISYSEEFGDKYINLTRNLISEFKNTRFIDWRENDTYLVITIIVGIITIIIHFKTKEKKGHLIEPNEEKLTKDSE